MCIKEKYLKYKTKDIKYFASMYIFLLDSLSVFLYDAAHSSRCGVWIWQRCYVYIYIVSQLVICWIKFSNEDDVSFDVIAYFEVS